jgi:ubiquinone/menaquinone biosynthesis C-methylase UbiE
MKGCEKLLDAGCGTGNYILPLAKHVKTLVGFEYNDGMLAQSRKKTAKLENVELKQGSIVLDIVFKKMFF